MELIKAANQLPVVASRYPALSQKLILSLLAVDSNDERVQSEAKMELITLNKHLLPQGKPDFENMPKYPSLRELVNDFGDNTVLKLIFLQVRSFCSALNVKYNMTEDQMIEAASLLMDESPYLRLEDFHSMFTLAKKGKFGIVYNRIDISVIAEILDKYMDQRREAGEQIQAAAEIAVNRAQGINPDMRGDMVFDEKAKTYKPKKTEGMVIGNFLSTISAMSGVFKEASELSSKEQENNLTQQVRDQKAKGNGREGLNA